MKPLRIDRTYEFGVGPETGPRGQANRRVLIVEDNDFVAHQCETALIEAGYEVVDIVTTADAAVKVALERRPALILMDIYHAASATASTRRLRSSNGAGFAAFLRLHSLMNPARRVQMRRSPWHGLLNHSPIRSSSERSKQR